MKTGTRIKGIYDTYGRCFEYYGTYLDSINKKHGMQALNDTVEIMERSFHGNFRHLTVKGKLKGKKVLRLYTEVTCM